MMSQGNDIDPRLRDIVQKSNSVQEDAPHANPSSPSIRFPPTPQPSLHVQPSQHPQQYPPYAQSHSGPYTHAYYGPSTGQQYEENESAADFQAFPTAPTASRPGTVSLKVFAFLTEKKLPFQAFSIFLERA